MYVPDGMTLEMLDQQAAQAVGPFLLGLSSPSCTSSGVAFMCSQVFHKCVSVALPSGSSGASYLLSPPILTQRSASQRILLLVSVSSKLF